MTARKLVLATIAALVWLVSACTSSTGAIQNISLAPLPAGPYQTAEYTKDSAGGKLHVVQKSPAAAVADIRSDGIGALKTVGVAEAQQCASWWCNLVTVTPVVSYGYGYGSYYVPPSVPLYLQPGCELCGVYHGGYDHPSVPVRRP